MFEIEQVRVLQSQDVKSKLIDLLKSNSRVN